MMWKGFNFRKSVGGVGEGGVSPSESGLVRESKESGRDLVGGRGVRKG